MDTTSAVDGYEPSRGAGAQVAPNTFLDKTLGFVPRALSSHAHIIFLAVLGVYLVVLPLVGVDVSSKAELIGGNYTNVTSDLGACIAAGLTVHLAKRDRRRGQQIEDLMRRFQTGHQSLQEGLDAAVTAAKRAEAAVVGSQKNSE